MDKVHIDDGRHTHIGSRSPGRTHDAQGRLCRQHPVQHHLESCGNNHVHHWDRRMPQALQDCRRNLMQAQKHNAEGRHQHRRPCPRRIVNQSGNRRCQHKDDNKCRKAHKVGNADAGSRLIEYQPVILQSPRLGNSRNQADSQGSRQDSGKIYQRHSHASQIAEQLRGLIDAVACHLQPLRHNGQIQIGHHRQHNAGS